MVAVLVAHPPHRDGDPVASRLSIACPSSAHMRRGDLLADGGEVLGWGEIAKGLVRPCVIEAMGEGVDAELEGFEAGREIFDAVELVSPRALGAFDVAVELGPSAAGRRGTGCALGMPPRTR